MTHRAGLPGDRRHVIVAALYHERPPPGASPEVLGCWVRKRASAGQSDEQISMESGLDIQHVRRIIGQRPR